MVEEVPSYRKIEKLKEITESVEDIRFYNQGLALLYEWAHLFLNLRVDDIQSRKE